MMLNAQLTTTKLWPESIQEARTACLYHNVIPLDKQRGDHGDAAACERNVRQ